MKFVDMFCGMGTIRMGFEQAGHECVYSIEFDKWKRKIYEVIFGNEPEGSDIRAVRADDIPWSDCWCFGAPCQDFSIAGLRSGMDGDRSSLVREVFRLVRETEEEHRPEWLLYENVKGMLSSNKGLDYLEILFEMGTLGYDIEWQLLNSKDFGVPQNRERVYTIGHLRARGERKIFPIDADNFNAFETSEPNKTAMYADCGVGHKWTERSSITPPLRSQGGGNAPGIAVIQIGNVMPTATRDNPNQGRVYDPTGLAPCLNKMEGGGREPLITEPCACLTPERLEKRQNGRRFKEPGEPMFTLTKQDIRGVALYDMYNHKQITNGICGTVTANGNTSTTHCGTFGVSSGTRIRRLTPRECFRLQGVPDYITDKLIAAGISDTQLYRAAGDACTVNVIYEIAKRLN